MKKHAAFQQHVLNSLEDIERDMAGLASRLVGSQHVAATCRDKVAKLRREVAEHLVTISFEKEKK